MNGWGALVQCGEVSTLVLTSCIQYVKKKQENNNSGPSQ